MQTQGPLQEEEGGRRGRTREMAVPRGLGWMLLGPKAEGGSPEPRTLGGLCSWKQMEASGKDSLSSALAQ